MGASGQFVPIRNSSSSEPNYELLEDVEDLKWRTITPNSRETTNGGQHKSAKRFVASKFDGLRKKSTTVETKTLYFCDLETGRCGFVQFLYSRVLGDVYKTFRFNFKVFGSDGDLDGSGSGETDVWESLKIDDPSYVSQFELESSNFKYEIANAPGNDGIGFVSIRVNAPQQKNRGEMSLDLAVRLGCGFKIKPDGSSYYNGSSVNKANIAAPHVDLMRHVFVPLGTCDGTLKYTSNSGKQVQFNLASTPIVFISALQGVAPNKAARQWNFATFRSHTLGMIFMEFTTPAEYGQWTVTVSAVAQENGPLEVYAVSNSAETSHASHLHARALASKQEPQSLWRFPTSIAMPLPPHCMQDASSATYFEEHGLRLVNKYDVLQELPSIVKNVVNSIAGIKPFIFQFCQRSNLRGQPGISIVETTFIS
ncbi:LAMI_0B05622g1_1 [Lachancea mirantina]|uniref:LAMI_0B05622g1_1 n=1 Tax=Lachancea mirantina TaxID=1230905 RepID=A0A1G4IWA8_9SACH|nr:LAMI_0B05622g1_1 [Lachancea mirantina]